MKRKPRAFDIFSLSFLDIIACGFGAVVLLVLISSYAEAPTTAGGGDAEGLLREVLQAEATVQRLATELESARADFASKQVVLDRLGGMSEETERELDTTADKAKKLGDDVAGLKVVESALQRQTRAAIRPATASARDDEVGGIPVDSDYVVFIVDTSGSMKQIWDRVTREVENVIRIHPRIKGFQILNDNGAHLISGYDGRWIPDTPARRDGAIRLFKTWQSASNSSPVEGLEVALKRYVNPNSNVSIYIFGDEYSGGSYDPVINALVRLNTNRVSGKRLARVHAVGFLSNYSTARFATLMREITRRNEGTFLALPR